jgi:surface protein
MTNMFYNANSLTSLTLTNWDTSNLTSSDYTSWIAGMTGTIYCNNPDGGGGGASGSGTVNGESCN